MDFTCALVGNGFYATRYLSSNESHIRWLSARADGRYEPIPNQSAPRHFGERRACGELKRPHGATVRTSRTAQWAVRASSGIASWNGNASVRKARLS